MSAMAEPSNAVLTTEDVEEILDEDARAMLGMSGEEFRERLAAGTLPNHPAVADLTMFIGAAAY